MNNRIVHNDPHNNETFLSMKTMETNVCKMVSMSIGRLYRTGSGNFSVSAVGAEVIRVYSAFVERDAVPLWRVR